MWRITLPARGLMLAATLLLTCIAAEAPGRDWDSCHDELDRTRRAASDASDAAEEAQSKLSDLENCRRDPDTYDLMGDGCRSRRSTYESAVGDYESVVGDFESKMEDLDSRLDSTQSECEYEFTLNRVSSSDAANQRLGAANRRLCSSYKRLMPLLTPQNVLDMCKKNMSEQWCKSCLGIQ